MLAVRPRIGRVYDLDEPVGLLLGLLRPLPRRGLRPERDGLPQRQLEAAEQRVDSALGVLGEERLGEWD